MPSLFSRLAGAVGQAVADLPEWAQQTIESSMEKVASLENLIEDGVASLSEDLKQAGKGKGSGGGGGGKSGARAGAHVRVPPSAAKSARSSPDAWLDDAIAMSPGLFPDPSEIDEVDFAARSSASCSRTFKPDAMSTAISDVKSAISRQVLESSSERLPNTRVSRPLVIAPLDVLSPQLEPERGAEPNPEESIDSQLQNIEMALGNGLRVPRPLSLDYSDPDADLKFALALERSSSVDMRGLSGHSSAAARPTHRRALSMEEKKAQKEVDDWALDFAIACSDGDFPDPDSIDIQEGRRSNSSVEDKKLAAAFNLVTSPGRPQWHTEPKATAAGPPVISPLVLTPAATTRSVSGSSSDDFQTPLMSNNFAPQAAQTFSLEMDANESRDFFLDAQQALGNSTQDEDIDMYGKAARLWREQYGIPQGFSTRKWFMQMSQQERDAWRAEHASSVAHEQESLVDRARSRSRDFFVDAQQAMGLPEMGLPAMGWGNSTQDEDIDMYGKAARLWREQYGIPQGFSTRKWFMQMSQQERDAWRAEQESIAAIAAIAVQEPEPELPAAPEPATWTPWGEIDSDGGGSVDETSPRSSAGSFTGGAADTTWDPWAVMGDSCEDFGTLYSDGELDSDEDMAMAFALAPGVPRAPSAPDADAGLALRMVEQRQNQSGRLGSSPQSATQVRCMPVGSGASNSNSTRTIRVYALSDMHTDFVDNMQWVKGLPSQEYVNDVLIVAGDVSDHVDIFRETFTVLRAKFLRVFFVPGNHDLWTSPDCGCSMRKYELIMKICQELGIGIEPEFVGRQVWVVPLKAWYCDMVQKGGGPTTDISSLDGWMDFYNCKWPASVVDARLEKMQSGPRPDGIRRSGSRTFDPVANAESPRTQDKAARMDARIREKLNISAAVDNYFIEHNEEMLDRLLPRIRSDVGSGASVITFSHFQPRLDLLPPRERLHFKELGRVCCSAGLERQLRRIGSDIHVFGHTHINSDKVVNGVRYVQHPLKYPDERQHWISIGREVVGKSRLAAPLWTSTVAM